MEYCKTCGHPLQLHFLEHEGIIPYCEHCKEFRFPLSNTAVSLIVLSPQKDQILLIQQYGRPQYILVAGYVDQKESLEEALMREVKEELGRTVWKYQYLRSEYFEKSNTLMCNFAVVIDDVSLEKVSEWEIDQATWFSFADAKQAIYQGSLAQRFLLNFFQIWKDEKLNL